MNSPRDSLNNFRFIIVNNFTFSTWNNEISRSKNDKVRSYGQRYRLFARIVVAADRKSLTTISHM